MAKTKNSLKSVRVALLAAEVRDWPVLVWSGAYELPGQNTARALAASAQYVSASFVTARRGFTWHHGIQMAVCGMLIQAEAPSCCFTAGRLTILTSPERRHWFA